MKIEVKKGTLPYINGVKVFISKIASTTTIWYKGTWNAEKNAFVTDDHKMVFHPNEVSEWHYYTDRIPYEQRPKKDSEPLTGVQAV